MNYRLSLKVIIVIIIIIGGVIIVIPGFPPACLVCKEGLPTSLGILNVLAGLSALYFENKTKLK